MLYTKRTCLADRFLIAALAACLFFMLLLSGSESQAANKVKVFGEKGRWHLLLNGQDFFIKGVGCGDYLTPENIDDALISSKELGANCIRRWGESDYDELILDKCQEYELMAMMGFWLPVTMDYERDELAKELLTEQVLDFIRRYKDHPSLLVWGIGNEVIILGEIKLKEQGIELSDDEKVARSTAFARYLETLCQKIKEVDQDHPIVFAGAGLTALEYIDKYTPSLDIYGVNFYGGAREAYSYWRKINPDIPYIFTEFGPRGPWEVNDDVNGLPIEPDDEMKARSFEDIWQKSILAKEGYCLGGFAFHLTEKRLVIEGSSPTWWGLTFRGV